MKITMYELLGMIKDGKTPKKIKYDNRVYTFDDTKDNYHENETCSINWDYVVIYCLNDEVEILEEPKGIPEKLDWNKNDFTYPEGNLMSEETADMLMEIQYKINNIIDILNKGENK